MKNIFFRFIFFIFLLNTNAYSAKILKKLKKERIKINLGADSLSVGDNLCFYKKGKKILCTKVKKAKIKKKYSYIKLKKDEFKKLRKKMIVKVSNNHNIATIEQDISKISIRAGYSMYVIAPFSYYYTKYNLAVEPENVSTISTDIWSRIISSPTPQETTEGESGETNAEPVVEEEESPAEVDTPAAAPDNAKMFNTTLSPDYYLSFSGSIGYHINKHMALFIGGGWKMTPELEALRSDDTIKTKYLPSHNMNFWLNFYMYKLRLFSSLFLHLGAGVDIDISNINFEVSMNNQYPSVNDENNSTNDIIYAYNSNLMAISVQFMPDLIYQITPNLHIGITPNIMVSVYGDPADNLQATLDEQKLNHVKEELKSKIAHNRTTFAFNTTFSLGFNF